MHWDGGNLIKLAQEWLKDRARVANMPDGLRAFWH